MPKVREQVVVECPLEDLAEMLAHRPADWLRPFLRIASHEGEEVGTRLQASFGKAPAGRLSLSKAVQVRLGDPDLTEVVAGAAITVPVHWEAAGYRSLFPMFDGRFVLRPVSAETTEVAVEGSYDPPGGFLGDLVDRMAARKAAQTSLRTLLANLRIAVEELIRATDTEFQPAQSEGV